MKDYFLSTPKSDDAQIFLLIKEFIIPPILINNILGKIHIVFVKLQKSLVLLALILLQACDKEPMNDPNPQFNRGDNTLFSAFTERPKHLDPARSYSADESVFTSQIYEPPLQYHYLLRPFQLVPLTAKAMPIVQYLNKDNQIVNENDENIAFSIYQITIKENIDYQPHPAFAKNKENNDFLYHNLSFEQAKNKYTLNDFPETGTRELIAEDYVYEIKRLADPTLNSPIFGFMENYIVGFREFSDVLQAKYDLLHSDLQPPFIDLNQIPMEGAKVIDRYTYQIKIKGKYPAFENWLAMPFFAPIPWEAIKFYSQKWLTRKNITLDWYPIGTGPFLLSENNPNLRMILTKNPNFHGETFPTEGEPKDKENGILDKAGLPLPFLDQIIFNLEKESIPYWNKFLQGYYDQSGVTSNNFDQALKSVGTGNLELSDALKEKNIRLSTSVIPSIFFWGFNMLDEKVGGYTVQKQKLRQAIAIALDIEEYINIFLNGSGLPAQSPLPPGVFGHQSHAAGANPLVNEIDLSKNQFSRKNIKEAKRLLREAGYPNGIDPKTKRALVLYFDTITESAADSAAQMAWIRKQFDKIGIDLVIRGTQYSRFQDKIRNGDFQIFNWGWSADYPDPENFFFLFYSKNGRVKFDGENATNYSNPKFDALFERMKLMQNSPERMELISQMIEILRQDVPWIGGYHPKLFALRHQWVGPVKPNEISRNTLKYISVDPQLRVKYQREWNQPVFWPLFLFLLLFILLLVPAAISYWNKIHRPKELAEPQSLKG